MTTSNLTGLHFSLLDLAHIYRTKGLAKLADEYEKIALDFYNAEIEEYLKGDNTKKEDFTEEPF